MKTDRVAVPMTRRKPGRATSRVEAKGAAAVSRPPPDREEWASMYGAFTVLRKESQRTLSRWHLTIPQVTILALLNEAGGPLPVTRLARLLLHEVPSVSGLVDRMCEGGLVERVKDQRDRRMTLVRLSDSGKRLHDEVRAAAVAVSEEMFGVLSQEDRASLKDLLQKFQQRNLERLR